MSSNMIKINTHELSPWSRALFQESIVTQLVKKFPTFYGFQRFITMVTGTYHRALSWARW